MVQFVNDTDERLVLEPGEAVSGDATINQFDGQTYRATLDRLNEGPKDADDLSHPADAYPNKPLDRVAKDELDEDDLSLYRAVRRSDAHPDMARYVLKAIRRDHTGVVSSARHFHKNSGVHKFPELGTPKEQALWNDGAVAALDGHTWDVTNEEMLTEIAEDAHGVTA